MPGTWDVIDEQPAFTPSSMLLLTDGRVLCQQDNGTRWFAFTPDSDGRYQHGTWAPVASTVRPRRYYASAVLRSGKAMVVGGEYAPNGGDDINTGEIYDPVANVWTTAATPPWPNVGDAPCALLADGRLLVGHIFDNQTALYDPHHDTWTLTGAKSDISSEETWTLLRDGTVLSVECNNTLASEKYVPSLGAWVDAGSTVVDLVQHSSQEIGPAVLLTDGRVFAIGATGKTALYTPPANPADPGTWTAGPDFPNGDDGVPQIAKDAPAVLVPNGRVLCSAGLGTTTWGTVTSFFEFDPATGVLTRIASPAGSNHDTYWTRMQLLPTGQVLVHGAGDVSIYTPDGRHSEAWEPQITEAPSVVTAGHSHHVRGRRFTGMSQANSYGDDCMNATNYPLARLRYGDGRVVYARTHNHSTMGVATGAHIVHTTMSIPASAPEGTAHLVIVANGIPSDPVEVDVVRYDRDLADVDEYAIWHWLIGDLADGPLWVIGPDGRPHPVPDTWPDSVRREIEAVGQDIRQLLARLQGIGIEMLTEDVRLAGTASPALEAPSSGRARAAAARV
jgi:hypothetical protein